eukprot:CAMPEP_0115282556 /NCGR_PEP_ID=MMETSP0270-20121206/59908_1 /TAXON_ID=71861 /ORGANISM="Scrippsiella trochoidea, Strain CCMP3099" /LENGTH=83 /DNA_ID=CAMNT_0002699415 /DNA_START=24 /DNA_END=272 /DNA_ORIENTATION=+
MDYCDPADYHHVEDGHDEGTDAGHGNDHGDEGHVTTGDPHGGSGVLPDHPTSTEAPTPTTKPLHLATGLDDEEPSITPYVGHD